MKKFIALVLMLCVFITILVCFSSCGNKDIFDTEYTFTKAVVLMPDGTVETFTITSWTDYSDSDMVQFKTPNGKVYLTHSSNVLLIGDD